MEKCKENKKTMIAAQKPCKNTKTQKTTRFQELMTTTVSKSCKSCFFFFCVCFFMVLAHLSWFLLVSFVCFYNVFVYALAYLLNHLLNQENSSLGTYEHCCFKVLLNFFHFLTESLSYYLLTYPLQTMENTKKTRKP